MNVYLFELDSVRNSEREIAIGQFAMFREIVANGNTVILSYNQLSDSAAFWAGLKDEDTYHAIMELCALGKIRVSLFAGQRTAAQYILRHIDECIDRLEKRRNGEAAKTQNFYFSLIPLDDNDEELLNDIRDAIEFSDVMLLKEKAAREGANAEKYLFLYRYVELILMLSRGETTNHRQKDGALKSLLDYRERVEAMLSASACAEGIDSVLARGAAVLRRVCAGAREEDLQRRSVWYKLLDREPFSQDVSAAEAIIDLCYNYAVEDSISAVEKRYINGSEEDFRKQFCLDMESYWRSITDGGHVLHRQDDARKKAQVDFVGKAALPDWATALHLVQRNAKYTQRHGEPPAPDTQNCDRAQKLAIQRRQWSKLSRRSLCRRFLLAGMYAAAFVIISYALNELQEFMTGRIVSGFGLGGRLLLDFISIAIFGVVSSSLFTRFKLPDILETVKSIANGIHENKLLRTVEREYDVLIGGDDPCSATKRPSGSAI